MEFIKFEDFKKIDLRVGKILEADRIENSEKLLKLKVDAGEIRQIVAGIGKDYSPQDLIGRQIAVVMNLEPKNLLGYESQGMMLAAGCDGKPVLLKPDYEITPGSQIK